MWLTLTNFVAFQIGWLACVLGAAGGVPLLGLFVAALVLGLHLYLSSEPAPEARLIIMVGALGSAVDMLQALAGVFYFYNEVLPAWVAPPWLIALWMIFATTLRSSLGWLAGRYWLTASFGAVGGPLAYYAGHRLGALGFPVDPVPSLLFMAIVWALLMPTLVWLSTTSGTKKRIIEQG